MNPSLSILDINMITQVSLFVVAFIQYIKKFTPEWLIKPYLQGVLGIGFSFLIQQYLGTPLNYAAVIINGIFAGMVSESGYQILSHFGLQGKGV